MIVWQNDDYYSIPLLFPSNLGALFLDKPLVLQFYNTKELCGVKNYGHHGHTDPESHLHHTPPAESSQWHLPHQPVKNPSLRQNASQQVHWVDRQNCLQFVLYVGDSKDLQRPDFLSHGQGYPRIPPMKSPMSKPSKHLPVLETNQSNDLHQDGKYKPVKHIHVQRLKTLHPTPLNLVSSPCQGAFSVLEGATVKVLKSVTRTCRLHENFSISWSCSVVLSQLVLSSSVIMSHSNGPTLLHRLHGGLSPGIVCQPLLQLVFRNESPHKDDPPQVVS